MFPMLRNILLLSLLLFSVHAKSKKWAFNEKFKNNPSSPSQDLLPKNFGYAVTHRTVPKDHFTRKFESYLADHDDTCGEPDPAKNPLPQHNVVTTHTGTSEMPDRSFFICNGSIKSSMGQVSPYSIASFYPRQEWDFSSGGKLEFEVTNNAKRRRHWWEVLVVPRDYLTVSAGGDQAPIVERYPTERMNFRYLHGFREMQAGTKTQDPDGRIGYAFDEKKFQFSWFQRYPDDVSMDDRRIRIRHRIKISKKLNRIQWLTKKPNKKWEKLGTKTTSKLPFTKGIIVFMTHSYEPKVDKNENDYTNHWDNIRFNGGQGMKFDAYVASKNIYLERDGDVSVGIEDTNTIDVKKLGNNPVLFGQVHSAVKGEVLVSVNGGAQKEVNAYTYKDGCSGDGWMSFQLKLDKNDVKVGSNTLKWTVGKRTCTPKSSDVWIGFSIKGLELHVDSS